MVVYKESIFSYGYDMKLTKYNFKTKSLECFLDLEIRMTALKLLKTPADDNPALKNKLAEYINGRDLKPLILHGGVGTGKTTIANLLPDSIEGKKAHQSFGYWISKLHKRGLDFYNE